MYLHENKELFTKIISDINSQTGISQDIIEKDYYVTMILSLLAHKNNDIVFKGGTSLSKCFHLINRFSEDIDITFSKHIGASRRKKLKYETIKFISVELGMPIENWDSTESDRDYNCYLLNYEPAVEYQTVGITTGVKLETALISYAFPTEPCNISSIIYDELHDKVPDIIAKHNLLPFPIQTQSASRTFIDKIFALCDYYLKNETNRFSRHLYDIHMIYPTITFDAGFKKLLEEVRIHRSSLSVCPSAKDGIDIKAIIDEFIRKDFFRRDYEVVTENLITDNVTYRQCVQTLKEAAIKLFE